MSGGQHRVDEVTRTESRRLDRKNNPRIAAHRPPKETAGLRNAGVCAKGIKKELKTLDVADSVRDVEKSASHNLSQSEIGSDNPCSLHLSERRRVFQRVVFLGADYRIFLGGSAIRDGELTVPCVLRARGPNFAVDEFLAESSLQPITVFHRGQKAVIRIATCNCLRISFGC